MGGIDEFGVVGSYFFLVLEFVLMKDDCFVRSHEHFHLLQLAYWRLRIVKHDLSWCRIFCCIILFTNLLRQSKTGKGPLPIRINPRCRPNPSQLVAQNRMYPPSF